MVGEIESRISISQYYKLSHLSALYHLPFHDRIFQSLGQLPGILRTINQPLDDDANC